MKRTLVLSIVLCVATGCESPTTIAEAPAFAVASTSAGCFIVPAGLVSWWPGDGNFDDVVGGNHIANLSGVTFDAGVVGQGFKYTGQNAQYMEVLPASNLHVPHFTVELWATKVEPGENDGDRFGTSLFVKSTTETPWTQLPISYAMQWRGLDDRITATVIFQDDPPHYGSPPIRLVSASQFPLPRTVHAALTYDGQVARLYVNGNVEAEFVAGPRSVVYGPGNLAIGSNQAWARNLGWRRTHNGIIDEFGIFDRALSQAEIQGIYNAGSTGKGISPGAALQTLIDNVATLELQRGLENALSQTLSAALASIDADRPSAIQQLYAFINQVEALRGHGLSDAEADGLIARAQEIIAALGAC